MVFNMLLYFNRPSDIRFQPEARDYIPFVITGTIESLEIDFDSEQFLSINLFRKYSDHLVRMVYQDQFNLWSPKAREAIQTINDLDIQAMAESVISDVVNQVTDFNYLVSVGWLDEFTAEHSNNFLQQKLKFS